MSNFVALSSRELLNNTASLVSDLSVFIPTSNEPLLLRDKKNAEMNFLLSFLPDENTSRTSSAISIHDRVVRIEAALSQIQDSDVVNSTTQQGAWDWLNVELQREQQYSHSPDFDIPKVRKQRSVSPQFTEQLYDKVQHQIHNEKLNRGFLLSSINSKINSKASDVDEKNSYRNSGVNESDDIFTTGTGYAKLWGEIASAINEIKTSYVDFYAGLMQEYTKMYDAYNQMVQKTAANSVSPQDDANYLKFDGFKIYKEGYSEFKKWVKERYEGSGNVFKIPNWDKLDDEQKEKMLATLKPAFEVKVDGKAAFDLGLFEKISNSPLTPDPDLEENKGKDGIRITTVQYQAWLAGFNSVGSAFQSNMQTFAQRYSQVNSTFDNLIKVLSSTISTLGDSAKDVLKSLS